MKFRCGRALTFCLICGVVPFACPGCKKSNNGSADISATVAGASWSTSIPAAGIYESGSGQFDIGGIQVRNDDSSEVTLNFLSPVALNQSMSSDSVFVDLEFIDTKSQASYDGGSGSGSGRATVTITGYDQNNRKIAGTFSGVLYNTSGAGDSVVVTNGTFNTSFIAQ